MKTFFAVSRCLNSKKGDQNTYLSEFHFKGYLWGKKVVLIKVQSSEEFEKGEDYILELSLLDQKDEVIFAEPLRAKKIANLKRKFF